MIENVFTEIKRNMSLDKKSKKLSGSVKQYILPKEEIENITKAIKPISNRADKLLKQRMEINMNRGYTNEFLVKNAFSIGNKKFAEVPLSEMRIDMEYQRKEKKLNSLIKQWDIEKCDVLNASYRGGYFYIMDGQHRYKAALQNRVESLPCQIREGLTKEDEATIFAEQDDNVNKLNPYDKFKANICRKENTDTIIKKVCDDYNITIKNLSASTSGNLKCLTKVRSIINNNGEECLRWIFDVIKNSNWHYESYAYGSLMVSILHSQYVNSKNLNKTAFMMVALLSSISFDLLRAEAVLEYPNSSVDRALKLYVDLKMSPKALKKSS